MQDRYAKSPLQLVLGVAWSLGIALSLAPVALGPGPAWSQENGGHEDGGHEDGGHEDDDHEEDGGKGGEGGKGQGGGQFGKPVPPLVVTPVPPGEGQSSDPSAGRFPAGSYLRVELGAARARSSDANWLPPNYPTDPQVFFDLDLDSAAMGAVAFGQSFGNSWRAEAALNVFGSTDFAGPWSYTVPTTPGPHADVQGSVRSIALFANGYYDFAAVGTATPFVTAGLGIARNTMRDWTRINPDSDRTTRSFEGGSDTGLAWSIGAGVAWDVGHMAGSGPAKLELTWRYFDLGSVTGGTVPLPGSGSGGNPVEALNFDIIDQVISLGLRIPL